MPTNRIVLPWENETQSKNLYWVLPRPKPDRYKGGMPLYAEEWLIKLAKNIVRWEDLRVLNLFCGMNKFGIRVDLNPEVKPDFLGDVHKLSEFLPNDLRFNVILSDPPYSNEECQKLYNNGTKYPKLNYSKWTGEADKFLDSGGLLIVYDKLRKPNPDPEKYFVERRVAIENRVNHVLRCAMFFRKK